MRPKNPSIEKDDFNRLGQQDKIRHLIKFAVLAPSSHNSQPWLFKVSANSLEILKDSRRVLAASDPSGRQCHISIGAAIENILIASAHFGVRAEIDFVLQGDLVAKIHFSEGQDQPQQKGLIEALLRRHNNRFAYSSQKPSDQFLNETLREQTGEIKINIISDQQTKNKIQNAVEQALEEALDNREFRLELSRWIKPSKQKFEDGMPGYNLAMPKLLSFVFPFIIRKFKLGKIQRKTEAKVLSATPLFAVISTKNDSKQDWIETGMVFEKIAVRAEAEHINTGVLAAAIEINGYYKEIQKILGISERPQIFFRLGYADKVPVQSPRIAAEKLTVN